MNALLELLLLIAAVATVTGLLIAGVVEVATRTGR